MQMLDNDSSVGDLKRSEEKMCDGALTAFRRAVREISRSAKLQAYNKNEEILKYVMATTARSAYRPSTGLDAARNPLC